LPTTAAEIDTLARRVAGDGDSVTRAQRLVSWMSSRLEWVGTDYQQRTPEQILARGAGNCADLASVLERLMRPAAIPYRWWPKSIFSPHRPSAKPTRERW
jgi:transglutaminase-like putative cysteine protease